MTVLDEILEAEKETIELIAAKKEQVASSVVEAQSKQKEAIENEKAKFAKALAEAKISKQKEVADIADKILTESSQQAEKIKQQFLDNKNDLVSEVRRRFQ